MKYNTQQNKLSMPEYGRNIQNMVDHCIGIEDRGERTKCANTIIEIMGNMFPHLRDVNDFKHILWDHLAIMSDFKLDIDYPYEIVKEEDLYSPPGHLDYSRPIMKYRHYGKLLEKMIKIAADMPDDEQREQLVRMLVSQMKKSYLQWNKDVDDEKIFHDLYELSDGKIKLSADSYVIPTVKQQQQQPGKRGNIKQIRIQRRNK